MQYYEETLSTFDYLTAPLTESIIFTTYQGALVYDSEKSFPIDFSQENREMYYRMKFKAVKSAAPLRSGNQDTIIEARDQKFDEIKVELLQLRHLISNHQHQEL